jgi:F-type H+-transporting ATPase subunit b
MPQFDPSSYTSQLFWLVVMFVALYWIVSKIAVPRIGEVLEQRARVIQDDLDRAAQLKAEVDAAVAAYEKAMAEARAQAYDHMRAIQADMKAVADKRTAEVTAQVNQQISEAEGRIASAKQSALDSIKGVAAETARDVVAKLAGLSPDAGSIDNAVATALKDAR